MIIVLKSGVSDADVNDVCRRITEMGYGPHVIRGEFKTIPTTLPGVQIAEHLPMLAKLTDKYSIIRGHDPKNGSHGTAAFFDSGAGVSARASVTGTEP